MKTDILAHTQPHIHQTSSRYVELDWLRVLAFGLLVFYHTGMLYSQNWGFHFKSQYLTSDVENFMLLLSPWRMALIWFVSGAAIRCLLQKHPLTVFLLSRTVKILLPLLVGIWLIVPIQLYAQMQQEANIGVDFVTFLRAFFDTQHPMFADYQAGIWPHVDVNHLWYLRSLWQFTLIIAVLFPALSSRKLHDAIARILKLPLLITFLVLLIPLLILRFNWPDDTFRYPMGFVFLMYGFLLVQHRSWFDRLCQQWRLLLVLFLVTYGLIVWGYQTIWLDDNSPQWQLRVIEVVYLLQRLLGVLALLALAMRFLTFDSVWLKPLNRMVFPFYLLHQSVIIALTYYLAPLSLGPWLEPTSIVLLTILLCGAACGLLAKSEWLKPFFGIGLANYYSNTQRALGFGVAIIVLLPLICKLLLSWDYIF